MVRSSPCKATLTLGLEILLSEENGWVDLQQGVGRLINAIVAVLGPELAPGSNFFSRCKSVIAEISSCEETAILLENIRFTQQLVLFAPQALSVHVHVKTLLPTLSSRQPALRHLAITTLRHLIEKDSVSIIHEKIEETLFHMLDEETDEMIGSLVRSTIMRLLYASCPSCPSHWISVCRKLVLATTSRESVINSSSEQDPTSDSQAGARLDLGEDDENIVSSNMSVPKQGYSRDAFGAIVKRERHLRYKTRVFAAECLSQLPTAVGKNPLHFDLVLARKQEKGPVVGDWLVLQLQELISLAYQISIIQFESMQPVGVELLSTIMDKFGQVPDPELPGCLLLEQYQAQLVSALRSALDMSSSPVLLEAGLQLATKVLISGIIRGDRAAIKRIFSLISLPLSDFEGLYYPSFAEWVSCKIRVRLLAAHASLKCHTYTFLRQHHSEVPDEYMALLPLFSKNSSMLGKRWIGVLKDYCFISLNVCLKKNWTPFLEGIKSPTVASKLKSCLEEVWPILLQAVALDAAPASVNDDLDRSCNQTEEDLPKDLLSGYSMVELQFEDFQFLWAYALLILFQGQNRTPEQQIIPLPAKSNYGRNSLIENTKLPTLKLYEVVLSVFQSLSSEKFFSAGFLTVDICRELLQVFSYIDCQGDYWNSLAVAVLAQIVRNCPEGFMKINSFTSLVTELCVAFFYKNFAGNDVVLPDESSREVLCSQLFTAAKTLLSRLESEMQLKIVLAFMLAGYHCAREASTDASFSQIIEFVIHTRGLLNNFVQEKSVSGIDTVRQLQMITGTCQDTVLNFVKDCIEAIRLLENRTSNMRKLVYAKLTFCLEQILFFADLMYKIDPSREDDCSMNISCGCIRSISHVLMDSNIHVQAIVLQVLKNMIQKNLNSNAHSFLLFISSELFKDILMVIKKIITEPVTRESTAFAGECLKTLVLIQTLPKEIECQKSLISLLLEVVVMILSETEINLSEERSNLRVMVIRLVSQVVQVPSVVIHLKEVLLEMSEEDRKHIQNIIRASVTLEHQSAQVKPPSGTLQIKLPDQSKETKERSFAITPPNQASEDVEVEDDDQDDDEDDWDAFQSFSTATNADTAGTQSVAENSSVVETDSKDNDFQEFSRSLPSGDAKEDFTEKAEPIPASSPETDDVCDNETTSEASQSQDLDNNYEVAPDVDTDMASSSNQQPINSTKDANEVDIATGNLTIDGSPNKSDLINNQDPDYALPDEEFTRSVVDSADQEDSNLQVTEYFEGDQPLKSAVESAQSLSSQNDEIPSPENVDSNPNQSDLTSHEDPEDALHDEELSRSVVADSPDQETSHLQVPDVFEGEQPLKSAVDSAQSLSPKNDDIVSPENVSSQSFVENLNIPVDQGTANSPEQPEAKDVDVNPETSQNDEDESEKRSTECERNDQNQDFSMSESSEIQAETSADVSDSPVLSEEEDDNSMSKPSEAIGDATGRAEPHAQNEENGRPLDSTERDGPTTDVEDSKDLSDKL